MSAPASRDDLVSVATLAERLGIDTVAAREWAEHWGLLRTLPGLEGKRGRRWIRWGDVLDLHAPEAVRPSKRAQRGTVRDAEWIDPQE